MRYLDTWVDELPSANWYSENEVLLDLVYTLVLTFNLNTRIDLYLPHYMHMGNVSDLVRFFVWSLLFVISLNKVLASIEAALAPYSSIGITNRTSSIARQAQQQ